MYINRGVGTLGRTVDSRPGGPLEPEPQAACLMEAPGFIRPSAKYKNINLLFYIKECFCFG
jgi:hypothetical protein